MTKTETTLAFGRHKGQPLGEVPTAYLLWLLGNYRGEAALQTGRPPVIPAPGKPRVPTRRDCPRCGKRIEVLTTNRGQRFYRCVDWQACGFTAWRPRAPGDCPCGGALFWAWSRKSASCERCGRRFAVIQAASPQERRTRSAAAADETEGTCGPDPAAGASLDSGNQAPGTLGGQSPNFGRNVDFCNKPACLRSRV